MPASPAAGHLSEHPGRAALLDLPEPAGLLLRRCSRIRAIFLPPEQRFYDHLEVAPLDRVQRMVRFRIWPPRWSDLHARQLKNPAFFFLFPGADAGCSPPPTALVKTWAGSGEPR